MNFFGKITMVLTDATLRTRILFVLFALAVFRLLANIPIPAAAGGGAENLLAQNSALGFFNVLTGGGLSAVSLMMLGVGPYITASIIMQLSTMMSSRLKAMYHEEGENGRRKFTQYSRLLTVPLAIVQGYALLIYLKSQGLLGPMSGTDMIINTAIIVGGALLIMWIGELISEFGIGNGTSLVIFAGIVAGLPSLVAQNLFKFDVSQIPLYLGFLIASIVIILGVVVVTEAERPIPITYAKRVRGMKVYGGTSTYLPLRLNQAGVIPIIFALSILVFPQMLVGILSSVGSESVRAVAQAINSFIANQWVNGILYFFLVFAFTFFYTAVTFEPDSVATNLQKNGAFIPGVRPGKSTAEYLAKVLTRITLVGAIFLGFVAVLPFVMQSITGTTSLAIGGTALLIVVSVVTDLIKKIDAQISMREY